MNNEQKIFNPNKHSRLPTTDSRLNDYQEAVSYLDSLLKHGIKPGLKRIKLLCEELGNPQNAYPVIQITGTNGKSSVSKITGAILTSNRLKTGVYISPHLYDYTERYSIDGRNISEDEFVKTIVNVKEKAIEVNKRSKDPLTNFEILTAIAFKYFADNEVDVAVLEVGMGGRFDATSLSSSSVCVITNVDLDHTDILGNTVTEIACEKASIIKEGVKAVTGNIIEDAMEVVNKKAEEVGVEVNIEGRDFKIINSKKTGSGCYVADIDGIYGKYKDILISLPGKYQLDNLALAIAASEKFINKSLNKKELINAASNIELRGRLQMIRNNPKTIVDVSHNPAGIKNLCKTLKDDYKYNKLITVVAVYEDKDFIKMIEMLENISDKIYITNNYHDRCADIKELAGMFYNKEESVQIEPSLEKAIKCATTEADIDDLICITGSFSTVSVAGKYMSQEIR